MATAFPSEAVPDPRSATFDEMFRTAARRVRRRRGVPEDRIDAEVQRIRRTEPTFQVPDFER